MATPNEATQRLEAEFLHPVAIATMVAWRRTLPAERGLCTMSLVFVSRPHLYESVPSYETREDGLYLCILLTSYAPYGTQGPRGKPVPAKLWVQGIAYDASLDDLKPTLANLRYHSWGDPRKLLLFSLFHYEHDLVVLAQTTRRGELLTVTSCTVMREDTYLQSSSKAALLAR